MSTLRDRVCPEVHLEALLPFGVSIHSLYGVVSNPHANMYVFFLCPPPSELLQKQLPWEDPLPWLPCCWPARRCAEHQLHTAAFTLSKNPEVSLKCLCPWGDPRALQQAYHCQLKAARLHVTASDGVFSCGISQVMASPMLCS